MNTPTDTALKAIESLLVRVPVTPAEAIGANAALESIRAAISELAALKAPKDN